MPDILFPELHPSVVEEWKKRQGAKRGYMGKTKQPKPVKAVQPKTTVTKPRTDVRQRQYDPKTGKLAQGPISSFQFKGTYEDYLNWYNTQSVMAPTETEIEKFESLYDKYKIGMIIEKVPQHLKQIVPMDWWKKFEIEGMETGSSELDDAIGIMEWGLSQGDRNKWTGGMTEIAYAAQRGLITPDEIYYTGLSKGDKAPPHIKSILEQMTLDIDRNIVKEPTIEEKQAESFKLRAKIAKEEITLGETNLDYLAKYELLNEFSSETLLEEGLMNQNDLNYVIEAINQGIEGEEIMYAIEEQWNLSPYLAKVYYIKALEVRREQLQQGQE